jgi:hypothetical protein
MVVTKWESSISSNAKEEDAETTKLFGQKNQMQITLYKKIMN